VRYYLYLSQAKLDMLFDQIPQKALPRLVTEAKVDLKVVGVLVQRPGAELTRYNRLDIVEGYLAQEYDIGWMTEPSFWFRGDLGLRISVTRNGKGPVFMTGSDGNLVVALVGSAHHVIGNEHASHSPPVPVRSRSAHSAACPHDRSPPRSCYRGDLPEWAARAGMRGSPAQVPGRPAHRGLAGCRPARSGTHRQCGGRRPRRRLFRGAAALRPLAPP
jgi:hypothetical protein